MLIETLIKEGFITEEQLKEARIKQMGAKKPIQELLVEMSFISEEDLVSVSSRIFRMTIFDLNEDVIDRSVLKTIPYETAKRYGVLPVKKEGDVLVLAMSNPIDIAAIDDIRMLTNMDIKPVFSRKSDISSITEKLYKSDAVLYDLLKNVSENKEIKMMCVNTAFEDSFDVDAIKEGDIGPIIKLINFIISDAVKSRASDIHIEPQEESVNIRYRVDGDLRNIISLPKKLIHPLTARIKVMSKIDLGESRKAQDGRILVSTLGRNIDLRVSAIPTYYGQNFVLRLLDPKQSRIDVGKLGFSGSESQYIKEICGKPQGMILAVGPTGSGKTSTLYALLNSIKSEAKNIITIEDPIEYLVEGITQTQVNPLKDLTFATCLRSVLRQDPNVILVGEIRDKETAEIAFRSSLTGHLVLSTLHTNDAIASVTRLVDIGLEPYLIASSIIAIISQRLVKLICPYCKDTYVPDKDLIHKFRNYLEKYNVKEYSKGKGCEHCGFTGYYGRTAIHEILKITEKVRKQIADNAPADMIFNEAKKDGFKLMFESGIEKVSAGLTTLEDITRVASISEEVKDTVEEIKIEKPPAVKEKARSTPMILIVDDEEQILFLLGARLENAGYEIIKARNGKEAIESAIKQKPDLLIMDVMMPVMSGFDAVKVLRSKLETASIPIIMLTAKCDTESEIQGLDLGADDYIGKPFESAKLLARVKMLLRRSYS